MGNVIDLTGQKFGRLTAIERDLNKEKSVKSRDSYWLCECSCERKTQVSVSAPNLKNKNTKSCGCLNSEMVIQRNKKYNTYDLSGEYGIGYTSKGEEFYFDLEDYNKIKDYYWYIDNRNYVVTKQKNKTLLFHRIVMNAKKYELIDHKYAITNDNRKSELRIATKSQNCQNSKIPINNTSGVKGVCYNNSANSWGYEIWCNNKRERKYGFTFEEAVQKRKEAEIRLHKDFRKTEKEIAI